MSGVFGGDIPHWGVCGVRPTGLGAAAEPRTFSGAPCAERERLRSIQCALTRPPGFMTQPLLLPAEGGQRNWAEPGGLSVTGKGVGLSGAQAEGLGPGPLAQPPVAPTLQSVEFRRRESVLKSAGLSGAQGGGARSRAAGHMRPPSGGVAARWLCSCALGLRDRR